MSCQGSSPYQCVGLQICAQHPTGGQTCETVWYGGQDVTLNVTYGDTVTVQLPTNPNLPNFISGVINVYYKYNLYSFINNFMTGIISQATFPTTIQFTNLNFSTTLQYNECPETVPVNLTLFYEQNYQAVPVTTPKIILQISNPNRNCILVQLQQPGIRPLDREPIQVSMDNKNWVTLYTYPATAYKPQAGLFFVDSLVTPVIYTYSPRNNGWVITDGSASATLFPTDGAGTKYVYSWGGGCSGNIDLTLQGMPGVVKVPLPSSGSITLNFTAIPYSFYNCNCVQQYGICYNPNQCICPPPPPIGLPICNGDPSICNIMNQCFYNQSCQCREENVFVLEQCTNVPFTYNLQDVYNYAKSIFTPPPSTQINIPPIILPVSSTPISLPGTQPITTLPQLPTFKINLNVPLTTIPTITGLPSFPVSTTLPLVPVVTPILGTLVLPAPVLKFISRFIF